MPSPGVAGIVVNVADPTDEAIKEVLSSVRERVDGTVRAPVHASIAGAPAIGDAFLSASGKAAEVGERIAVPLLLIVLLFVFRSLIAAALPVVIGGAVVLATRGILDLLLGAVDIASFALGAVGMMGLALGVDYSLLMVSRFREEVGRGADPAEAMRRTVATTGPTVVTAGAGLSLAMLVASQFLPGVIVASVSLAIIVASLLSVLSAVLVVPAILMLLGPRLDRWAWPHPPGYRGFALRLTSRLARRPRLVVLPVVLVLIVATIGAFALNTDFGTAALLPTGDPSRRQQEDVQDALGPGWIAPYEIVMQGGRRPVTTPGRLKALAGFQREVEDDPGVATMAGFAGVERATRQLGGLGEQLSTQQKSMARLSRGLSKVHQGAALNTSGLLQAADGASRLGSAIGATHGGAGQLAKGLQSASSGSAQLSGGLERASDGSGSLASGTAKASSGAGRLSTGLTRAKEQTGEMLSTAHQLESAMSAGDASLAELATPIQAIEGRLGAALTALNAMTTGRGDSQYATALEATEDAISSLSGTDPRSGEASSSSEGLTAGVEEARGQFSVGSYLSKRLDANGEKATEGMAKLARGSTRLDEGLAKLSVGSRKVSDGVKRLSDGGQALSPGLRRLSAGAERLTSGLGKLEEGTGGLAGGLGGGAQKSKLLTGALGKIGAGVEEQRSSGSPGGATSGSPGIFRSGYFYLASLDGSAPANRSRAGFLVSLDRGGHAARMLVIPRQAPSEDGAQETRQRIEHDAERLASDTGTKVIVGGATPTQLDLNSSFRDQAPLARLILALVTIIILVPVLRSLTIPVVAALLNVLTVAATFGFLALLFNNSLLGGPGYVDTTVIPATIMVIFGLAIDYEVFIFARMREEYERTGSTERAIVDGLERTAPVVTGAALIMIVVFLAFATSSFFTIRGFGVAQAIAVFIDAFLIRLIVIPALMRVMGRWAWWMPGWLDRLLPGGTATQRPSEAESA
jgi:RND superfamily putative drug exporter